MAIPDGLAVQADVAAFPQQGGRKHLQRIIRKVKLVLVVKHCIDDLKSDAGLRRCGDDIPEPGNGILNELPGGPAILSSLRDDLRGAADKVCDSIQKTNSKPSINESLSKPKGKQLLVAPGTSGLLALETLLDTYIAHSYDFVHKCKQNVISTSRDLWISWAKKRGSSVYDNRSQAILIKLLDEAEQLHILQGYLDAYIAGSYAHARERLIEVVTRLRGIFGSGWFFEWPCGRHPLNTTWPWADVRPSLLVLWGVCWMFFPTYYGRYPSQHTQQLGQQQSQHNSFDPMHFLMTTPTPQARPAQPTSFDMAGHHQMLVPRLPAQPIPNPGPSRLPGQAQPITNHFRPVLDWVGPGLPRSHGAFNSNIDNNHSSSHLGVVAAVQSLGGTQSLYSSHDDWSYLRFDVPNNSFPHLRHPRPAITRNVAERNYSWPQQPHRLGENCEHPSFKAATRQNYNTQSIHNPPLPPYSSASSSSMPMPPSTSFSYPPLDNMSEIHDPRPYMDQERAYPQMGDPHEYGQHHDTQQDQPRYPSPPPPLSENPYNPQQAAQETPDSRMDLPMEQKSESDAPSPGRSKPVPKPDREVTKDATGRFYCNWPNCTEEVKDFGRKCEWSKHMDKHDRPYKCPAEGCEKLPGFTYSGGLLRHEREVHNKHGGPRKQLNCPHPNCKRHTGKGFSRQENLNEHLRRVHTDTGLPINGEETEDEGSEAQPGGKRKRTRGDSADLREEMKRLRQENEELRRQAEAQTAQSAEMMRQIMQLQQAQQLQATMQHPRMQAPPAQMT